MNNKKTLASIIVCIVAMSMGVLVSQLSTTQAKVEKLEKENKELKDKIKTLTPEKTTAPPCAGC